MINDLVLSIHQPFASKFANRPPFSEAKRPFKGADFYSPPFRYESALDLERRFIRDYNLARFLAALNSHFAVESLAVVIIKILSQNKEKRKGEEKEERGKTEKERGEMER